MLKLALAGMLTAAALSAVPALADTSSGGNSGIGRGCTLDPFNHTMRCIDFDHCTTDKNGNKVCPVVVTPTRVFAANDAKGKSKGEASDYLVVTLDEAAIME